MPYFNVLVPSSGTTPTKSFLNTNGEINVTPYPKENYWHHGVFNIPSIRTYHEQDWSGSVLIRGLHKHPCFNHFSNKSVRRRSEVFPEHDCCWVMVDVDEYSAPCTIDGVQQFIKNELPEQFRDAACSVQFSASAGIFQQGLPLKEGLNCHLTFFLNRPLNNPQVKQWLKGRPVDMALYTPVQPHYVTDPVIGKGVDLRLEHRRIFIDGHPEVKVPDITVPESQPYRTPPPNQTRNTLRDVKHCHFIQDVINNGAKGYVRTRAFCHNAALLQKGDEIINRVLTGYKNEEAIRRSLKSFSLPILCKTIVEDGGFECPSFCGDRCSTGARAPIAIAGRSFR